MGLLQNFTVSRSLAPKTYVLGLEYRQNDCTEAMYGKTMYKKLAGLPEINDMLLIVVRYALYSAIKRN